MGGGLVWWLESFSVNVSISEGARPQAQGRPANQRAKSVLLPSGHLNTFEVDEEQKEMY